MNEMENTDVLPESTAPEVETDTTVVSVVGVQDLQVMTSDLVHANLFGSFLVCGTLIGAILCRRFLT